MHYFRKVLGSNDGKVGSSENGPYVRNGVEVVDLYWRDGGEQPRTPMHMVEPVSVAEWSKMDADDQLALDSDRDELIAQCKLEIENANRIIEAYEAGKQTNRSDWCNAVMTIRRRTTILHNIESAK
jgi:hypothetical protein